jgi:ribosomal protein L1
MTGTSGSCPVDVSTKPASYVESVVAPITSRSTVSITQGRSAVRVAVFARGAKADEAKAAGFSTGRTLNDAIFA